MLLIVLLVVSTLAMSLYDSAPPGKLVRARVRVRVSGDVSLQQCIIRQANIIWATLTLTPTLPPGKLPKPYLANMGKRFVTCFAAGHTVLITTV